jgi:hypothetical protein
VDSRDVISSTNPRVIRCPKKPKLLYPHDLMEFVLQFCTSGDHCLKLIPFLAFMLAFVRDATTSLFTIIYYILI